MFCPNDECPDYVSSGLRAEYRDDIAVCPYCETFLVGSRPEDPTPEAGALDCKPRVADDEIMELVIEANDLTEVAVIKSVLDAAKIPYLTQGENQFAAFRGAFAGGSIFNSGSKGVIFTVPSRMAEEARTLLKEFDETVDD